MGFLWQETHRVEAPEIPQFPSTTVQQLHMLYGGKRGFSNLSHVLGGILRVTFLQGKNSKLEKIGAAGRGPEPIVIVWGEMGLPYKLGEQNPSVTPFKKGLAIELPPFDN